MSTDEPPEVVQGKLRKALGEIVWLHQVTEDLQQTCDELNLKVSQMNEDRAALVSENQDLSQRLAKSMNDLESFRVSDTSLEIQEEARREMERLREENSKLESEHRMKLKEWEKQLSQFHTKAASVDTLEEELTKLRDENDVLRQAAEKVAQSERTIAIFKRKLEQMEDIKSTMRQLESVNAEAVKKNFRLEEELKDAKVWKDALDEVKEQLATKQKKLLLETERATKAETEAAHYRERLDISKADVQRLTDENDRLTLMLEEIQVQNNNRSSSFDDLDETQSSLNTATSTITEKSFEELIKPATDQKLILSEDNLESSLNNSSTEEGAEVLILQLRKHEELLAENFRKQEQQIAEMRRHYEDQIELLKAQNLLANEKLARMEYQSDQSSRIPKTNTVRVRSLEPLEVVDNILDSEMSTKDLQNLRTVHAMEETLLASAFYNYGQIIHRSTTEMRNKTLLHRHRMNVISRRTGRGSVAF